MAFTLPHFDLDAFVRATLAEDLGPTGTDVTSQSVIPADVRFEGTMDSRDAIVVPVCRLPLRSSVRSIPRWKSTCWSKKDSRLLLELTLCVFGVMPARC